MRNRRLSTISTVTFLKFGIERSEVRQPSLVDSFYIEKGVCAETGAETYSFNHPLYMLFNQERLNRLGDGAVQMWLKSLEQAGNSAYQNMRSKLTDSEMLTLVKSRHIQSPSELENWLNFLNERADLCNKEVAKVLAEEKERKEKEEQSLTPPVSPTSSANVSE